MKTNMHDAGIHHRRSIRVKGYDYAQDGAYFVTICAQSKQCLFGDIAKGEMKLNDVGRMVNDHWIGLKNRFSNIEIDEFIVMPNHFHGIIVIFSVGAGLVSALPEHGIFPKSSKGVKQRNGSTEANNTKMRADTRPAPTNTVGDMMCAFKSLVANEYIKSVKSGKFPPFEKSVWQRNYYEHIIRDDNDLDRIREYIINNPLNWEIDELYSRIRRGE